MSQKCRSCGDVEMIEADTSDAGLVCPQCGRFEKTCNITSNGTHVAEPTTYHNPNNKYVKAGGTLKIARDTQQYRREKLDDFGMLLDSVLPKYTTRASVRKNIMKMFEEVCFGCMKRLHEKTKKKGLLACTLLCLQDEGIPAILITLVDDFQVKFKGTQKIVYQIANLFEKTLSPDTYIQSIERLINDYPLISNEKELLKKIPKLLNLLDATSFQIGRDRTVVSAHIAYLAYISKDEKNLKRMDFKTFLNRNRLKMGTTTMKDLYDRLVILIKKLPWIKADQKINFSNFHIHLNSAIQHSSYLIDQLAKEIKEEENKNNDPSLIVNTVTSKETLSEDKITPNQFLGYPACYLKSQKKIKRRLEKDVSAKENKKMRIAPTSEELTDEDLLGETFITLTRTKEEIEIVEKHLADDLCDTTT